MEKWDYLVKVVTDGASIDMLPRCHLESTLNNAGEEGWDLVSAIPTDNDVLLVMKRPKR
jgi:hypothetical protein